MVEWFGQKYEKSLEELTNSRPKTVFEFKFMKMMMLPSGLFLFTFPFKTYDRGVLRYHRVRKPSHDGLNVTLESCLHVRSNFHLGEFFYIFFWGWMIFDSMKENDPGCWASEKRVGNRVVLPGQCIRWWRASFSVWGSWILQKSVGFSDTVSGRKGLAGYSDSLTGSEWKAYS